MKYCRQTTEEHPFCREHSGFIDNMNAVMRAEGCGRHRDLSGDFVCLPVDKVEEHLASLQRRDKRPTVDMVFGVQDGGKRIVLCEMKCNQKAPNFDKSNTNQKIAYTKSLIGSEMPFGKRCVFICPSNILDQMKSKIRRAYSNKAVIEVRDLEGFVGEIG